MSGNTQAKHKGKCAQNFCNAFHGNSLAIECKQGNFLPSFLIIHKNKNKANKEKQNVFNKLQITPVFSAFLATKRTKQNIAKYPVVTSDLIFSGIRGQACPKGSVLLFVCRRKANVQKVPCPAKLFACICKGKRCRPADTAAHSPWNRTK